MKLTDDDPTTPGVKPPTLADVLGTTNRYSSYGDLGTERELRIKYERALRAVVAECDCHGHHIARVALGMDE